MRVIFLRHGTRNYGIGDVPLNSDGLEEARALSTSPSLAAVTHIWCSPKTRALMTVGPLAEALGLKVQIHKDLDQQNSSESAAEFNHRVDALLEVASESLNPSDTLVLCSHSDWLSLAVQRIPTSEHHVKSLFFHCATFKKFQIQDGLWHLK